MVISEIKQINSPYIKLIKDESELAVPIHLVAHEVIEKYENCNCFDTSSLSINGYKKQINFFNERIIYELHCEDENNIYVWQDISFKQLKDIDGLCVFSDSEPIITRKEKQRKNQKLSLQKFWFPVYWNEKGIG